MRFVAHFSNFRHVSQLLVHQGALKNDEHEQCKQTVPYIFIKTPKKNTKNLKNKEWSRCPLFEEFLEFWYGHIHPNEKKLQLKSTPY